MEELSHLCYECGRECDCWDAENCELCEDCNKELDEQEEAENQKNV